jgi:AmmeMemoRadiSam system protein A
MTFLEIAQNALEAYVSRRERIEPAPLGKVAACFVSYHDHKGDLRGCIGTLSPVEKDLAFEIVSNAIAAAMRDPRFLPIEPEELPGIRTEVSVLGDLELVPDTTHLDVKRFGVVVQSGGRRGVLLPDLEGIETVSQQISIAKRKAHIPEHESVTLKRFEVIKYS